MEIWTPELKILNQHSSHLLFAFNLWFSTTILRALFRNYCRCSITFWLTTLSVMSLLGPKETALKTIWRSVWGNARINAHEMRMKAHARINVLSLPPPKKRASAEGKCSTSSWLLICLPTSEGPRWELKPPDKHLVFQPLNNYISNREVQPVICRCLNLQIGATLTLKQIFLQTWGTSQVCRKFWNVKKIHWC